MKFGLLFMTVMVTRPDGFNLDFFFKNDILGFMSKFHSSGSFNKNINASFIALIPKCIGPLNFSG